MIFAPVRFVWSTLIDPLTVCFVIVFGFIYYSHLFTVSSRYGNMKFSFCEDDVSSMSSRRKSYVSKTVADVGIRDGADEFSEGVASAEDGDSGTGVG